MEGKFHEGRVLVLFTAPSLLCAQDILLEIFPEGMN